MVKASRILVVENDKTFRNKTRDLLTAYGFQVFCVETGLDAISHLHDGSYDLVLTEIILPGLSGNHLVDYMHGLQIDTPIAAITHTPYKANDRFHFVFKKPIDPQMLLSLAEYTTKSTYVSSPSDRISIKAWSA